VLRLTPPQALPRPQGGCHQRKRDGDGHRRLRGGWSTSWCACPWRPSGRPPHLPPPWSKAQGAAPILPSPLPVSSNRVVRRCCRCRGVVRSGGATGCKGAVRAWTDSHRYDEWQETSATSASLCLGRHGADEHASHPLTLTMLTILSVAPVEIPLTKSIIRATHSYFQT
jgi:hypothetical protein